MASAKNHPNGLCIGVVILIFFLTFLLPFNMQVGLVFSMSIETTAAHKQRRPVLGSRPPQCTDKCFSCRPCMATLVIPPHRSKSTVQLKEERDDEGYYLLSWKCRCGDKLFQP